MSFALRPLLITLLCLAWLLPGLVAHDPWKPDEAYTFGVVFEILLGGSWVIPQIAGEAFIEKPPLFHLVAAASAWLFSPVLPLHDGARLSAGLWIGLALLFTALASRELNGPRHGLTAVLLLLGCLGLVVRGHQLIPDVATLAGFAMAYYSAALALRRAAAGGFWLGTAWGLIFMTQGIPEAVMATAIAVLLPVFSADWRKRNYALTLGVACAAALPWLSIWPLLLHQHDPALFAAWVQGENLSRFFGTQDMLGGLGYYLRTLPWYAFPVWPLALWAVWRAHKMRQTGTPALVLPVLGFLVTLLMLGRATESRELYALPMLVPLALLAVPGVDLLRRGAANGWYWFSVMAFTFFILVGWFYWGALELGVPARLHAHLHSIRPGYDFGFHVLPFVLGLAYTAGWFVLVARLPRNPEQPLAIWAGGITAVWALLATLFIGWVDTTKSYRSVISDMQRAMPAQYNCIASRDLGESQRALLHYFAGIRSERLETKPQSACDLLLVQGVPLDDMILPPQWQKIWEGHRPGDKDERLRLYRLQQKL
ncbi:MAG: glycosyltransferase family 39 protein [Burkholderiales bacterium]|nr:glycosyltransferase family 39 protein [Burkholderiales bacterium]MDP2398555.1 glycosyltransferase family 39 protein [Burkholderiales bacterium]